MERHLELVDSAKHPTHTPMPHTEEVKRRTLMPMPHKARVDVRRLLEAGEVQVVVARRQDGQEQGWAGEHQHPCLVEMVVERLTHMRTGHQLEVKRQCRTPDHRVRLFLRSRLLLRLIQLLHPVH